MRSSLLAALALLAGCAPRFAVDPNDGYTHIAGGGLFECANRPVSVDGHGKDLTLVRGCHTVRILGSHDDVLVYAEPDTTIQVAGDRNTVVYRLQRPGPAPRWQNGGDGNELLHNSHAPWDQDGWR